MQATMLAGRLGSSLLVLACPLRPADPQVVVVDASGGGDVLDIQAGVDAVAEGGTVLVRTGSYTGFAVQAKSVFLVAESGAYVNGPVRIEGLPEGESVIFSGFVVRTAAALVSPLRIVGCAGSVRIADVSVTGTGLVYDDGVDGTIDVLDCRDVVLAGCTVTGANGADGTGWGELGAIGIRQHDSTLALHDSFVRGGTGGEAIPSLACGKSGDGGAGVHVLGWSFFYASGNALQGGAGGPPSYCSAPGQMGFGLRVAATSSAHTLDNATTGGISGDPGPIPGTARKISFPVIAPGGSRLALVVRGVAGDRVLLTSSDEPGFRYLEDAIRGVLELDPPLVGTLDAGIVPGDGYLELALAIPKPARPNGASTVHLQALLVSAEGARFASGGLPVQVLWGNYFDCNGNGVPDLDEIGSGASPDCDSNGIPDGCDLAAGTATDCDGNGVLDACDVAAGAVPDCNANGVPDACDVSGGRSFDCNSNGVPDECDLSSGTSVDCNANGIPDECSPPEIDCNANGIPDACDLPQRFVFESEVLSPIGYLDPQTVVVPSPPAAGGSVRFEFESSADLSDTDERILVRLSSVDLGFVFESSGFDCPFLPDEDELAIGSVLFNDSVAGGDAIVELIPSSAVDSNECSPQSSYIRVVLSYATNASPDCNANGVPDECEPDGDCNGNGQSDLCDIGEGLAEDCNANSLPDECEIASGAALDCNGNGVPDECDLAQGTSADVDGDGTPDECQPPLVLYVDESAPPNGDGSSWPLAFTSLQPALLTASILELPAIQIWIADGTYRPTADTTAETVSFVVPARTALYGGFAGDETSLGERDPDAHPAILSGDLLGDDLPGFVNYSENSRHVVSTSGGGQRLDGLTIRGGNATALTTVSSARGGGLYLGAGPVVVERCRFTENRARLSGGAVEVSSTIAEHVFLRCEFDGNLCTSGGAGGIQVNEGSLQAAECVFRRNQSDGTGGAVQTQSGDNLLMGCLFHDNFADRGAGLSSVQATGINLLVNCTFARNQATQLGAGVHLSTGNHAALVNCILWGNTSPDPDLEADQIAGGGLATSTIDFCCVEGLHSLPGQMNQGLDPAFLDPDGADGVPGNEDDDFRLPAGSSSNDSGWNGALPPDAFDRDGDGDAREAWPIDLDDAPRFADDPAAPDQGPSVPPVVDHGAYERAGGG